MTFYLNATEREKAEKIVDYSKASDSTEGLSSKWFTHFKDVKEKKEFASVIRNNQIMMDAIKTILVREYEELLKEKPMDYDSQNWPLKQADKAGYKRAIQNFMTLMTISKSN